MTLFSRLRDLLQAKPTQVSTASPPSATAHTWRCHAAVLNIGIDLSRGLWNYELSASFNSKAAVVVSHHSMVCQSNAALQHFQSLYTDQAPIYELKDCSTLLAKIDCDWRNKFFANVELETEAPGKKMDAQQVASSTGVHSKANNGSVLAAVFQSASLVQPSWGHKWQAPSSR